MNIRKTYYSALLLLLVTLSASAQYIQVDDTYTPQQLVENVLLNNACASVSNVHVSGAAFSSGQSYGYFSGNGSSFPFQNGIILSTGRAVMAVGPNTSLLDDGAGIGWGGDTDLEQALGINNSTNATVLEFDFIPLANTVSFDYMLSSEEYHDNAPCNYSDGFAFLLRETANPTAPYTNLAIVPGTTIPVKVTSVRPLIGGPGGCSAQNEQYFDAFNGTEHPTNFNGQTRVMTATSTVVPGTQYHIKLVIADETNYRYDSAIFLGGGSFSATTDLGPDRLFAGGNPLCAGESYPLDGTTPNASDYQWYKDNVALTGATSAVYTATTAGTYKVVVAFNSTCTAEGEVKLEYAAPVTFGTFTLLQCDDNTDGLTTYNLLQAGQLVQDTDANLTAVSYHLTQTDADNDTNAIANYGVFNNTTANQPVYVRVKNQYGCFGVATVILSVSSNTVANPEALETCDTDGTDDGIAVFNLNDANAEILSDLPAGVQLKYYTSYQDALTYTDPVTAPEAFNNTSPYSQIVYARINQGSDCYGIAEVQLLVHSFGGALDGETLYLCDDNPLTLDAGSGYSGYIWDTTPPQGAQEITVTQPGTYSVILTNDFNCTGTKTFTVLQSGEVIAITTDIADLTGGQNAVTVHAEGLGDFEYSLDGIHYQDSNIFVGLGAGQYTVFARDKNGCGNPLTKMIYILDYPKYFTPNGDSYNDTWRIKNLEYRPGTSVEIFDRYGKLITTFYGTSIGWDGTLAGKNLPATDYWFVVTLENGRTVKGHFALIR